MINQLWITFFITPFFFCCFFLNRSFFKFLLMVLKHSPFQSTNVSILGLYLIVTIDHRHIQNTTHIWWQLNGHNFILAHHTAEEEKKKKKKLCTMFEGYSSLLKSYGFRLQFLWSKAAVSVLENMFFISLKEDESNSRIQRERRKKQSLHILHDLWTIHG